MHLKHFMNQPLLAPLRIGSARIAYTDSYLESYAVIYIYLLTPYLAFPCSQAVHFDFCFLKVQLEY